MEIAKYREHATASAAAIKTMFRREMLANGVLMAGSHNICYAHNDADIDVVLSAYSQALETIRRELQYGTLEANLRCAPIEPVFAVR